MGLKIFVAIFLILLIIVNIIVFFFVRGVNLVDRFKTIVLSYIEKYLPIGDPLLVFLLLSFVAIIVITLVMLKVFAKTS
jgi:hypothetical protein